MLLWQIKRSKKYGFRIFWLGSVSKRKKSVKCFATYFSPQIFEPFWLIWCNEYIQDTTFFYPKSKDRQNASWKSFFPLRPFMSRTIYGSEMDVGCHSITKWTLFCPFLTTYPTYLYANIDYPEREQKMKFFDPLPTSPCPRSYWTTPDNKLRKILLDVPIAYK